MEDPESYKIFSFCEQTLKMSTNYASGQGLQCALKNKHQTSFFKAFSADINVLSKVFTLSLLILHTLLRNLAVELSMGKFEKE
jgi:hypothetical protein